MMLRPVIKKCDDCNCQSIIATRDRLLNVAISYLCFGSSGSIFISAKQTKHTIST